MSTEVHRTTDTARKPTVSSGHTPGPWRAVKSPMNPWWTIQAEGRPVGELSEPGEAVVWNNPKVPDEVAANAYVIAAAPALLSELKAIKTLIDRADIVEGHRKKCLVWKGTTCDCRVGIAMERINKLIDTAEGRS